MKLRTAVIGLGKISETHLSAWKKLIEDVEVRVLVDVDRKRAEARAREWGVPEFETDFKKVLNRSDIDVVDLCLPHHLHAPYACEALEAGKHVLVEKPIATTLQDATKMIAAAEKTGKKLMVSEQIRFYPMYKQMEEMITRGDIGEPFYFSTRSEYYVDASRFQGQFSGWRSVPEQIGGGVLLESAIHNVAVGRYVMGEVESVFAMKGKQTRKEIPVENTLSLMLRFENGSTGIGSFSWGAKWSKVVLEWTVYGRSGIIVYDLVGGNCC